MTVRVCGRFHAWIADHPVVVVAWERYIVLWYLPGTYLIGGEGLASVELAGRVHMYFPSSFCSLENVMLKM